MKVTLYIIIYFLAKLFKKINMSKKRKRRFILVCVLALSIRSTKVNADLFAEGFKLGPLTQKAPKSRPYSWYKPKFPTWRRAPKTMLEARKGSGAKISSYYSSEFDCKFLYSQLQAKFKHAFQFGIKGNYNTENRELFFKALLKHMREFKPRPGTFHGKEVDHYLDPDTGLNVMIDKSSKLFISGWKLNDEQLENVIDRGSL